MNRSKKALILGATGGIGGEIAAALLRNGWSVTALTRDADRRGGPALSQTLAKAHWVVGDAMKAGDVRSAAEGADAIVHAVNPPGYRKWGELVLPMIDNTIAAAQESGARIVLPGTIYNYGYDAFPALTEDSPQHPVTGKGRIRVELERRLEVASSAGTPALIVRFGDFFGPAPGNNWFGQGLVTPGRKLASIRYPGKKGVGHAWAYLPDAGETVARLLDRAEELETFARYNFAGVWDPDGTAMPGAIARALGRPGMKVRPLPWSLVGLAGLFMETPRELYKMRYLWRTPIRLDNTRLVAFQGEEPHTPLDEAVRTTLRALDVR